MPLCLAGNHGAGSHLERGYTWSRGKLGAGFHLDLDVTWIVAASAAASAACLTPTATIIN